jgi:hypothetical protein
LPVRAAAKPAYADVLYSLYDVIERLSNVNVCKEKNGLLASWLGYVRSLRPLRSVGDLELDPIIFGEALEAVSLDGREVNENVWAVLLLDEPKTLGVVEPLHGVNTTRLAPVSKGPLGHLAQKNAAPLVVLETGV